MTWPRITDWPLNKITNLPVTRLNNKCAHSLKRIAMLEIHVLVFISREKRKENSERCEIIARSSKEWETSDNFEFLYYRHELRFFVDQAGTRAEGWDLMETISTARFRFLSKAKTTR